MTTEEAIKTLERAEGYVGIHYINGVEDPYINPCLLKAIDYAIAALRAQQEQENPNPLTLEELREMDDPVWCLCKTIEGGNGYWCLCQKGLIITPAGISYHIDEIPHWVFLRHRPKEESKC